MKIHALLLITTLSMLIFSCKKLQEDLTPKLIKLSSKAQAIASKEQVETKYIIDVDLKRRGWNSTFCFGGQDTKNFTFDSLHTFRSVLYADKQEKWHYDRPLKAFSTSQSASFPLFFDQCDLLGPYQTWEIVIRQGSDKDLNSPQCYERGKECYVLASYTNPSSVITYEVVLVAPWQKDEIRAIIEPNGDTMHVIIILSKQY